MNLAELSERLLQLASDEGTAQIHDVALKIAALSAKADWVALCASDAACYYYPGDEAEQRLAREAFCRGAATVSLTQQSNDR